MPPKKKKSTKKAAPKPTALAAANLPAPRRVAKSRVGEAVQDFIDFGGATAIEAHEESSDVWLVTATA